MKTLLLILTVFTVRAAAAQHYTVYHDSINAIERTAFVDNDYKSAINRYIAVFNAYPFCFSRDYVCAAQLAAFAKDYKSALVIIGQSFKNGLSLSDYECLRYIGSGGIKKVTVFDSLFKNKKVRELLAKALVDGRKQYKKRVNIELKRAMNGVFIDDQIAKNNPGRNDGPFANKYHFSQQKIEPFYDSVIKKYGYPGERLIGVDDSDAMARLGFPEEDLLKIFDHRLADSADYLHIKRSQFGLDKFFSASTSLIPMLHNSCAYQLLGPYLEAQIDAGNLHPREAAIMLDFTKQSERTKLCTYKLEEYLVLHKNTSEHIPSKIERANEQRKQLHIQSTDVDMAKALFAREHTLMLWMGFFFFL